METCQFIEKNILGSAPVARLVNNTTLFNACIHESLSLCPMASIMINGVATSLYKTMFNVTDEFMYYLRKWFNELKFFPETWNYVKLVA